MGILTISDFFKERPRYEIDQGKPISYEYGISGVIEQYFADQFTSGDDTGKPYVLRSLIHGTNIDKGRKGIVLVDHDQWFQFPDQVKKNNWLQPVPWSDNEFIGDQYWRASIAHDGMLVSNIGGELKPVGIVKLAYPSIFPNMVKVLAVENKDILFLSDSDYFVNRLLSYQLSLVAEVLGSSRYTVLLRFANLILVIATMLLILNKSHYFVLHVLVVIGIILASVSFTGKNYECLRYIGPVFDPHDPARAWAVKRVLIDNGIKLKPGESEPTFLVLAAGESAHSKNEKLIVAEPGAKIYLNNQVVIINETPLGVQDGIIDARQISVDGITKGPRVDVNGVQIIGTGSPAKIPRGIWYQFLPQ